MIPLLFRDFPLTSARRAGMMGKNEKERPPMDLRRLLAPLLCLALLSSCAPAEHTASFLAMDTVMSVTVYGQGGQEAAEAAGDEIKALEKLFSVTDEGSELYAANHSGGRSVTVSADTAALLEQALELCGETEGALDVTIYPVVKAWGFTTGTHQVPDDRTLAGLVRRVDFTALTLDGNTLTVPEGMELDLGAVAKGFAADRAAEVLRSRGVECAKLELGGNVHLVGQKPGGSLWRIAVRDPSAEGYVGVLETDGGAVVTSGGYERYFEQDGTTYWHILDPATGRPAHSGLVSVTIAARSGVLADALSTALFVMGKEKAGDFWRARQDFDFILIGEDGSVTITPGVESRFTLSDTWKGHTVEVVSPSPAHP